MRQYTGPLMGRNSCWLAKGPYIKTRAPADFEGKRVDEMKVIITRLLCFLRGPTDANFDLVKRVEDTIGNDNRVSTTNMDKIF